MQGGHHNYLFPVVFNLLPKPPCSILEIGTGDGLFLKEAREHGYDIQGIEIAPENIELSRRFGICHERSILGDISDLGKFDVIVSMEVVEHLTYPRWLARNVKKMLTPDGVAIITAPYHGYLKNLAISVVNGWDAHLPPFWDDGHIKFWSHKTLSQLFVEQGMIETGFHRVGRFGPLAMSMVGVFQLSPP